jgi:hypothetical protein
VYANSVYGRAAPGLENNMVNKDSVCGLQLSKLIWLTRTPPGSEGKTSVL